MDENVARPLRTDPRNRGPSVSVALCTYNGDRYLRALLESLVAQTRLPDELVVCDDCSSDATIAMIEQFKTSAPFSVVVHRNRQNLGTIRNFEQAIGMCTRALIALCDQDDVWFPNKIERSVVELSREPDPGFVFGDSVLVDADLTPMGKRLWEAGNFTPEKRERAAREGLFEQLAFRPVVNGPTMVFRSELRQFALPFPPQCTEHDDWIALVGSFLGGGRIIDEPLLFYRVHVGQAVGLVRHNNPGNTVDSKRIWKRAVHKVELAVRSQRLLARAELLEVVAERAPTDRPQRSSIPRLTRILEDRAAHFRVRAELPERRLSRLVPVSRELLTGRYGKYSGSPLSALKDIGL